MGHILEAYAIEITHFPSDWAVQSRNRLFKDILSFLSLEIVKHKPSGNLVKVFKKGLKIFLGDSMR